MIVDSFLSLSNFFEIRIFRTFLNSVIQILHAIQSRNVVILAIRFNLYLIMKKKLNLNILSKQIIGKLLS